MSRPRSVSIGLMLSMAVGVAGCADPGRLFKMHTSTDRRADAERSWRGVRSKVKLQLAQDLFNGGNTREARAALQEVAGAADDEAVLLMLAKIELAEGHLSAARQAITAALALPDPAAESFYVAGLIDERYQNYDEAAQAYQRALLLAPNEADYLIARAEAVVKLGRPVEAIRIVDERLSDFPEDVSLRLFVAETNQMLGLKAAAVEAFREAVRLSNDNPRIREQFGLALEAAGRDEEAIRILLPLVGAAHADVAALRTHGSIDVTAGKRDPVPPAATDESHRSGPSRPARRALARAYLRSGMPRQARGVLTSLLTDNANDAEGWALMTRVGFALGDAELARESAERLAALDGNGQGWLLGAYAAMKSGDSRGALRNVTEVLNNNPRDVMALCMLACVQAGAGEKSAAIRTLDHALRIDPDCSQAAQLRRQLGGEAPAAQPSPPPDTGAARTGPDSATGASPQP